MKRLSNTKLRFSLKCRGLYAATLMVFQRVTKRVQPFLFYIHQNQMVKITTVKTVEINS